MAEETATAQEMWHLVHYDRPWTLNAERAGGERGIGGHLGRAALTETWKHAFAVLARQAKIPPLAWARFEVWPFYRAGTPMPDTGNEAPAVKAAIDGIVAAGVLPDDAGPFVHHIGYNPPQVSPNGRDALILDVIGERA